MALKINCGPTGDMNVPSMLGFYILGRFRESDSPFPRIASIDFE